MISSIVQAVGVIFVALGIGWIYPPAGVIALGVGTLLFGLALGTDK
jgi:hypothetical protein